MKQYTTVEAVQATKQAEKSANVRGERFHALDTAKFGFSESRQRWEDLDAMYTRDVLGFKG